MLYYRSLFNFFMTEVSIISYRNQSIDFQSKSMDRFLYDRDLRHERVKYWLSWHFDDLNKLSETNLKTLLGIASVISKYFSNIFFDWNDSLIQLKQYGNPRYFLF